MCYVPTSSHLRAVLMSWAVFGMSGPFSVSFSLKTAAEEAGDQRKGPLLCYVAVIRKRTLFPLPVPSPPRTPGCNVLPGLESQCAVALAPETRRAPHTRSSIPMSPRAFMYVLTCVWAAVNISSHRIIHVLHLMQYLTHVHCITIMFLLLHTNAPRNIHDYYFFTWRKVKDSVNVVIRKDSSFVYLYFLKVFLTCSAFYFSFTS